MKLSVMRAKKSKSNPSREYEDGPPDGDSVGAAVIRPDSADSSFVTVDIAERTDDSWFSPNFDANKAESTPN